MIMKTRMMMTGEKKKMMIVMMMVTMTTTTTTMNCEVGSDDTDVTGSAEDYGVLTVTVL